MVESAGECVFVDHRLEAIHGVPADRVPQEGSSSGGRLVQPRRLDGRTGEKDRAAEGEDQDGGREGGEGNGEAADGNGRQENGGAGTACQQDQERRDHVPDGRAGRRGTQRADEWAGEGDEGWGLRQAQDSQGALGNTWTVAERAFLGCYVRASDSDKAVGTQTYRFFLNI